MARSVSVKEEIYTHEYLWRSSSLLLEKAKAEDEAAYKLLIPSLLMGFLAFEAFVNFCGFVLLPEKWKEEKKNFKGEGIEGKLKAIKKELPGFSWQKGRRPYQTIKNLERFRDIIAHGMVMATGYVAEQQEDGSHFRFKHPWDCYMSVRAIEAARADIKSFCQSLLVEMRKVSGHQHLIFEAFEGGLANAEGEGASVGFGQ
ncbi:MAG: hypothetical protein IMZ44_22320 [Planctomycetes bacterium]|nr:hypothetical protein [Planctomycetota bacterium]